MFQFGPWWRILMRMRTERISNDDNVIVRSSKVCSSFLNSVQAPLISLITILKSDNTFLQRKEKS